MRHGGSARLLAGTAATAQVAALVLAILNTRASHLSVPRLGLSLAVAAAVALYAGVGRAIASRLPGNPIGWLLSLTGLLTALSQLAEQYALFGLATAPGSVPGARVTGWLSGTLDVPSVILVGSTVLLFPDGRLPSRRWRPVAWAIVLLTVGAMTSQMQAGVTVAGSFIGALAAAGISFHNPVAIFPEHGWFSAFLTVLVVIALATVVLIVASVFARRRGATFEQCKQLEWLGYVGLLTALWVAGLFIITAAAPGSQWAGELMWYLMFLTPVAGIPLASAVAILKYRLYEIDRLVSRTVSYAIVTGFLVAVYAALVLLASAVLPREGSVTVTGATLVVAALFNPARRRVQHVVDRRFNRSRYDAELTVASFAARLQDATDPDGVRADLAATVDGALEPRHLSLWWGRPTDMST